MAKQTIRDQNQRIIGYIDDFGLINDRQKATDARFNLLGHYDPHRNVTTDPRGGIVGRGNMLAALIDRANR
ncbi:hypothetical protein [Hoeflea sp.]|uniref:hypothetical protein n=1 Tax=Hoeflea sp. TaxID=1940281 RepID=UPI0019910E83|nr:hypothetical protein [Hoeflea sp.]MBC7285605.1 hypothetical protein [Hoeflea sp.]